MLLRLQSMLSALTSVAAVVYAPGRLKSYYFFQALVLGPVGFDAGC